MVDKILFWFGVDYTHYCLSHALQKKIDCEMYAIVDITERPKTFFENQKLVDFNKIWFFHDQIKKQQEKPDFEYLAKFEKKYKLNLWKLIQNERIFLYSNFHKFSKNEMMKILEQECRFFEHILDTVKPDFFFSKMPAFHHLELFYEMCKNSGVNVQIIDFAVLGQSCMITQEHEKLDIVNDPKGLEHKNRNSDQLLQYLKSSDLLGYLVNNIMKPGKTNQELIQAAKEYILHSDSENTKTHYTYYGRTKSKVLLHGMMYRIRTKIRESFMNNNLKRTLALPEKFVFFPLHTEIDRTLLITAPFYINQTEAIKIIAKSLPINFKLVVKEHPIQITRGWRSSSEYKEIMEIPNVILVHPDFSNEELYKNCSLLVTIAGTSGFEATFYGKPAITFVDLNYSILPSVSTVKNLHELPDLINESLTKKVEASSLDHFITLLEKNISKFNYADFLKKLKREFFYGGNLVDVEIPEAKMKLFLEKNHSVLSELADEHITKIKWFKNH